MSVGNNPIVIIPMESFRWKPRVRFMESFPTRSAALSYAFQHDCNLIVENNEGSTVMFDVMQDPNGSCKAGLNLKLMRTEDVLVEPAPGGWTAPMSQTLRDLAKRFTAFLATLSTRQVVQFCRRAANFASLFAREIAPILRNSAVKCWAESKKAAPQHNRDVVAPHHSCTSQLP